MRKNHNIEYSSKKVESILEKGIKEANPFFQRIPYLKDKNILFMYTASEMTELINCSKNVLYFAENYLSIDDTPLKLKDFQKSLLENYIRNKFNISKTDKYAGSSTVNAILILWEAVFNFDYSISIIAYQKRDLYRTFDKIEEFMKQLPFFMKPGIVKKTNMQWLFDNGSSITNIIIQKNGIIAYDRYFLVGSEYFWDGYFNDFLMNALPIISHRKKSKLVITGSPLMDSLDPKGRTAYNELIEKSKSNSTSFKLMDFTKSV